MDPNDSMRKRTPLPLQDWLWGLDRIQERLARLLPERDLHVGFSLEMVQDRITNLGPSENELATFPFGVVLDVTSLFVYFRPECNSGILWLDLRKECLNRWRVTPAQDSFMDLEYKPLKDLLSNPVLARARTWYYYSNARPNGDARPRNAMRQGDFLSHILDIQDALVEACSLAPDAVVEKLGGDRSAFGCHRTPFGVDTIMAACRDRPPALWDWLTVLSYMTLHKMHALLKWWVEDLWWCARDPLGEPEFSTINNYWIALTPDFRTATEYGLDVLRHLTTRELEGQPNGADQLKGRAGGEALSGLRESNGPEHTGEPANEEEKTLLELYEEMSCLPRALLAEKYGEIEAHGRDRPPDLDSSEARSDPDQIPHEGLVFAYRQEVIAMRERYTARGFDLPPVPNEWLDIRQWLLDADKIVKAGRERGGPAVTGSGKNKSVPAAKPLESNSQVETYRCPSWDAIITAQEIEGIGVQFGSLADTLVDLASMVREMDHVAPREIGLDRKVEVFVKPTGGVRELADEAELAEDACIDAMTGEGLPPDPGLTAWQSQETVGLLVRILASARKLRPTIEMVIGADQARIWYVDLHKTLTYREYTTKVPHMHGGFRLRLCMQWRGVDGSVERLASRVEHWYRNLMLLVNEKSSRGSADGNAAPNHPRYVFKNEGATWRITYEEHETTVNDSLGMKYICYLLEHANTSIECLDIEGACSGESPESGRRMDAGEAMDADLRTSAYDLKQLDKWDAEDIKSALNKLKADIEGTDDPARKAQFQKQADALDEYLRKNLNKHGQPRSVDKREQARSRVQKAISAAKRAIKRADAYIGDHFAAVKGEGTAYIYKPSSEIPWTFQ